MDSCPTRSPLVVADHLIEHSRGKVVYEIGTRNGDILDCVSRFSAAAYCAEIDEGYCEVLRHRNLTVFCSDFMKQNLTELPRVPHVFFWWPMRAMKQNESWLLHLRQQFKVYASVGHMKAIIAFDHQWREDMVNKAYMLSKYPEAVEFVVSFNEGLGRRECGKFSLVHFPLLA